MSDAAYSAAISAFNVGVDEANRAQRQEQVLTKRVEALELLVADLQRVVDGLRIHPRYLGRR